MTEGILSSKVAIVTGAASGLGRSIAIQLSARGAQVVVSDVNDSRGLETVEIIKDQGGIASFKRADVSSRVDNEQLVSFAVSEYGGIDIAVNNAGIAPPATPLAEVSDELWQKILSINLNGVFYGIRAQINAMLKSGGGTIINIASILGQVGFPGMGPYVASKHALVGLTKQIAVDYASLGIRSISIGPAFIKTGLEKNLDDASRIELESLHPVGRMGEPDEVGAVVAAVSSPEWSFVNGAYIPIDGGFLSR